MSKSKFHVRIAKNAGEVMITEFEDKIEFTSRGFVHGRSTNFDQSNDIIMSKFLKNFDFPQGSDGKTFFLIF